MWQHCPLNIIQNGETLQSTKWFLTAKMINRLYDSYVVLPFWSQNMFFSGDSMKQELKIYKKSIDLEYDIFKLACNQSWYSMVSKIFPFMDTPEKKYTRRRSRNFKELAYLVSHLGWKWFKTKYTVFITWAFFFYTF